MGGGTAFRASSFSHRSGLSPRGRGNLLRQSPDGFYLGSIPAWAGEPHPAVYVTGESPVYPRVGGGTINDINPLSALGGLSPRGRGNRGGTVQGRPVDRSIPAWAGEPANRLCAAPLDTVYPRVGGGTISWCISIAKRYGLSPRGRGNLIEPAQSLTLRRSIPAWAGEPFARNPQTPRASVYPRVGGGTIYALAASVIFLGLSPRGRGNLANPRRNARHVWSIPAWAGEPGPWQSSSCWPWVYPRVGGGTTSRIEYGDPETGLSPRGRGNRLGVTYSASRRRSIPAWAGEPIRGTWAPQRSPVYPRVGGGT